MRTLETRRQVQTREEPGATTPGFTQNSKPGGRSKKAENPLSFEEVSTNSQFSSLPSPFPEDSWSAGAQSPLAVKPEKYAYLGDTKASADQRRKMGLQQQMGSPRSPLDINQKKCIHTCIHRGPPVQKKRYHPPTKRLPINNSLMQ